MLYPLLGQSFQIAGIPNRVIGLALMIVSGCLALSVREKKLPPLFTVICSAGLIFTCLLHADPIHFRYGIATSRAAETYFQLKLAYILCFVLPAIILATLLSMIRASDSMMFGICLGFLNAGIIAALLFAINKQFFIGQTYELAHEFSRKTALFSVLGFSQLSAYALFSLVGLRAFLAKRIGKLDILLVGICCIWIIQVLLLRQRAHAIVLAGFILAVPFLSKRRGPIGVSILAGIIFLSTTLLIGEAMFGETFIDYWRMFASGEAFSVRAGILSFVTENGSQSFLGRGLASFSLDYPDPALLYPHNILFEAYYELGFSGLSFLTVCYFLLLYNSARLLTPWRGDPLQKAFAACSVFASAHYLKAADLGASDVFFFFCIVVSSLNVPSASAVSCDEVDAKNPRLDVSQRVIQ